MSAAAPEITLDSWLAATIGNPARRAAVRACVDSLDDFRAVELVDLEETIGLARWPVVVRLDGPEGLVVTFPRAARNAGASAGKGPFRQAKVVPGAKSAQDI